MPGGASEGRAGCGCVRAPPPPPPRSPGRGSAGWERGCRGGRFALARGVSLSAGTTSAGAEGEAAAAGRRAAAFPSLPRGGEALAFPQPPSWGRNAAAGGPEEYVPLPKMTLEDDRLGTVPGRVWLWKGSYFKILCDFSFQICRGEMGRKKKKPFWRSTQFSNFSLSETGFHTNTSCLPLELLCFCFPTR